MVHQRHAFLVLAFCLYSFCVQSRICADPSCDCIVEVAKSQIGSCEEGGNNRGYAPAKYLRSVGKPEGLPWCSAFVAWVLNVCGIEHAINAWSPTATARKIVWERGKGKEPQGGDVFSLYYQSLGRVGHAGIIEKWGDKYATTIEGNTNDVGSRDGDCVLRKIRHHKTIYRVSRWD